MLLHARTHTRAHTINRTMRRTELQFNYFSFLPPYFFVYCCCCCFELCCYWNCYCCDDVSSVFTTASALCQKPTPIIWFFLSFSCNIWMFSYWCCLHCCVLPLISFLYVEEIFFGSEWNGFSFSSAMNIVLWPISFRMRSTKHQPSRLSLCDWSYSRLFFIHFMARNEKKYFFAAVYLFFPSLTQIQVFNQKENICLAYKE